MLFLDFKYCHDVYCTNIAHADNIETVMAHYSKYSWVSIGLASDDDVEIAKRKGMPIVELGQAKHRKK